MNDKYFSPSAFLEVQGLRTREFAYPKELVFKSVMSALKSLGYEIHRADQPAGLITGASPKESDEESSSWTDVTAFIEEVGAGGHCRVRMHFVSRVRQSSGRGAELEDKPLLDEETYDEAFERIEKAIVLHSER